MNDRLSWPNRILAHAALILVATLFAAPLALMLFSSFKTPAELSSNPYRVFPQQWRPENYVDAVQSMPFATYLRNSFVLCVGSVVGSLLSCSMAAYAFARLRWRGRSMVFAAVMTTMLLPWHVTMLPRFLLMRELGLYNSLAALILPTFLGDAFFIFLLRQFFMSLPQDVSEAARLDGLSEWGIYWRIVLPMSAPALATVGLFQLITSWNDFGGPLLYLNDPQKFPLAYGLERFVSSYADQTHLLLAAAVLFMLPIVILFFVVQQTLIRGIATRG